MFPEEDHGDARDPERLCHGGPRRHLVEHRAALPQVGVDVVREGGRRPASSCLVCQQWYRSLAQSSAGIRTCKAKLVRLSPHDSLGSGMEDA